MSNIAELAGKFWPRVQVGPPDQCWPWIGTVAQSGYGSFVVSAGGKRKVYRAHRVSYALVKGDPGPCLDHLCRNKSCVNPNHLEAVTTKENILRGDGPSARHARQTHCVNGHLLEGDNLYIRKTKGREGRRQCRACDKRRLAARKIAPRAHLLTQEPRK